MGSDPFLAADNDMTIQRDLRFHFHNNHFTVDIDDSYVLRRAEATSQPPSVPYTQNDGVDRFLQIHCIYSLHLHASWQRHSRVLFTRPSRRDSDHDIRTLGVDYLGDEDRDWEMAPLTDERWQTQLGKAILAKAADDDDFTSQGPGRDAGSGNPGT